MVAGAAGRGVGRERADGADLAQRRVAGAPRDRVTQPGPARRRGRRVQCDPRTRAARAGAPDAGADAEAGAARDARRAARFRVGGQPARVDAPGGAAARRSAARRGDGARLGGRRAARVRRRPRTRRGPRCRGSRSSAGTTSITSWSRAAWRAAPSRCSTPARSPTTARCGSRSATDVRADGVPRRPRAGRRGRARAQIRRRAVSGTTSVKRTRRDVPARSSRIRTRRSPASTPTSHSDDSHAVAAGVAAIAHARDVADLRARLHGARAAQRHVEPGPRPVPRVAHPLEPAGVALRVATAAQVMVQPDPLPADHERRVQPHRRRVGRDRRGPRVARARRVEEPRARQRQPDVPVRAAP